MMERLRNSWALFNKSLQVMMENKKLIVFPVITAVLTFFIFLFFAASVLFQPTGHAYSSKDHWKTVASRVFTAESYAARQAQEAQEGQAGEKQELELRSDFMGVLALLYLAFVVLGTFCNVAFYHAILSALCGRPVSIMGGFRFAMTRIKPILFWSLLTGLIGLAIRKLEERFGLVGKLVLSLIGTAWSAASMFVIPCMIYQAESNPVTNLKSSAGILKKTWGESLIGFLGIHIGFLVIFLGSIGFWALAAGAAFVTRSAALLGIASLLWFAALLIYSYLMNVANHVYRCALYLYASQGKIPLPYDQAAMTQAWKFKK